MHVFCAVKTTPSRFVVNVMRTIVQNALACMLVETKLSKINATLLWCFVMCTTIPWLKSEVPLSLVNGTTAPALAFSGTAVGTLVQADWAYTVRPVKRVPVAGGQVPEVVLP